MCCGILCISIAILFFGFKMRAEYRQTEHSLSVQLSNAETHIIDNQNTVAGLKASVSSVKARQTAHEQELKKVEKRVSSALKK